MVDVVLADGFSMLTTTLFLEALRFGNLVHRRRAFDWKIRGVQSGSPRASNGFTLEAQSQVDGLVAPAEIVFLNVSYFPEEARSDKLFSWLRAAHRHGAWILAVDTAPLLLAEAGLLTGKRATIHWDDLESARELFPGVDFRGSGIERSGRIYTCCGGMAVLDMTLEFLSEFESEEVAQLVRQHFFLKDADTSLLVRDKRLFAAVDAMRQAISVVLPLEDIAARANISFRQMHRKFEVEFGVSPGKFYTALRLQKAQSLLLNSAFSISDIAVACGYSSASWFGKAYKSFYGITPLEERLRLAAGKSRSVNRLAMFFQPSASLIVNVVGQSVPH